MEKRYMAIYLYGFLFSVLLFVVLYFVGRLYFVDFHYLAFSPRENDFLEGEYWEKVFFEDRDYFSEVENFYNSIEDWDFDFVGFSAEKFGKEIIYWMRDEYLDESFIVQPQYSLNKFLRLFLKSRNYPKDGCSIIVLGNYQESYNREFITILGKYRRPHNIYQRNRAFYQREFYQKNRNLYHRNYDMNPSSQMIIIQLYYNNEENIDIKLIYSPQKCLYFDERENIRYESKFLEDGWYFLKTYHDNLEVFVD